MRVSYCYCDHGRKGRCRTEVRLEFAGGLWDAKISAKSFSRESSKVRHRCSILNVEVDELHLRNCFSFSRYLCTGVFLCTGLHRVAIGDQKCSSGHMLSSSSQAHHDSLDLAYHKRT